MRPSQCQEAPEKREKAEVRVHPEEVEEVAEAATVENTAEDTNSESTTLMKKDSPLLRMRKHTTHTTPQGDNREVLEEPSTVEEEVSTEEENTTLGSMLLESTNTPHSQPAKSLRVKPVDARTLEVIVSETSQEKSPVERDVEANLEVRDAEASSVENVVEESSAVSAESVNSVENVVEVNSAENVAVVNSEARDAVENSAENAVEVNSEAKDAEANSVENVVEVIDLIPSTNVNIEDVVMSELLM